MKKSFVYAMMSAIALSGAVSFSACSSSDELTDVNPSYDGESVKTQFTISLPQNLQSPTRMGYATVQEAQTIASFRGMSGIVIIPYSNATARTTRLGSNIALGANTLIKPSAENAENAIPSGNLLANSNAVLYNDVTIPVGTAGFLFYGKATGADGFANGALTAAGLTGEADGISFTPVPIQETLVTTKGEAIAAYVSAIAGAKDATDATITWAGCADATTNSAKPWYNAGLGALYTNFTSLKAGASAYVQAAVQDLYTSIKNNTDVVSVAIKTAIETKATPDTDGKLTFDPSITGYPGSVNNSMPDGCATLTWSGSTATASTNSAMNLTSSGGAQSMDRIVYPAALYYFVDSDIKTSNTKRAADYNASNDWDAILATYINGTAVSSSTNSVAITKPIQYAVGRLDVTVNKLNAAKYYDRKGDEVTIPAGGFQLTGVLIGGQKPVDYKFEQNTTGTEYAIYDKTINTQNSSSETGVSAYLTASVDAGPNYTLALETAAEQDVYVVLEFLNSGDDFQGFDGVVKKGCKFYMVALLVPDEDVTDKVSGTVNTGKKVFKQDFNTIANFTIGAGAKDGNGDGISDTPEGFANAYVTIPDLRTPQLELGFSVDLTWREGITFNYTF